jgi:hypothetical protein
LNSYAWSCATDEARPVVASIGRNVRTSSLPAATVHSSRRRIRPVRRVEGEPILLPTKLAEG